MTSSAIQFDGDTMKIGFSSFDGDSYALFLKAKRLPEYRIRVSDDDLLHYEIEAPARFAGLLGVDRPSIERPDLGFPSDFMDDQDAITQMALDCKRFACWSDCGLGKTFIGLEFARQVVHRTGGRALIVTRNEIAGQWLEEADKFYGPNLKIGRLESRAAMKEWCGTGCVDGAPTEFQIAVTNTEKFIHETAADQVVNECRNLAAFVLDEASILKGGGGKLKWALIKSARGILYKLALTATPAPNEVMEFASQASFLEKLRDQNEIIWTYFRRDEKTHRWTVKKHARKAFFEFMAGWSIYVRDPRRYGWRMNIEPPPEPVIIRHDIPITPAQRQFIMDFNAKAPPPAGDRSGTGQMFAMEINAISSNKLSQAAKGFVYVTDKSGRRADPVDSKKPAAVAELIRKEAADGHQVLVWTVYDAESDIIAKALGKKTPADVLTGKTSNRDRVAMLDRFRHGDSRILISRASMLGYGMNMQHCSSMIFSGWTFSYEQFYQAIRRAYRHGQTKKLRVHIPIIPELEGQMFDAICRKDQQHENAIAEMEIQYIAAMKTLAGKVCAA